MALATGAPEMVFKMATKEKAKLRMAIMGPSKSGKTYTSMRLMEALAGSGKWAVIDTENGSASKYADDFSFPVLELTNHSPDSYIKAIVTAYKAGYEGLIIDSMSHEWMGKDGCLDLVDQLTDASPSKNSFSQWGKVTPRHREVFDVINRAPLHVICTFRVKTEYAMEPNANGKISPVKVGLAPVTKDGAEYEFDILMDMNLGRGYIDHTSRCPYLQYLSVQYPGEQVASLIKAWLNGEPPAIDIAGAAQKEETLLRLNNNPKPKPHESGPRPSVPSEEEAAKASKPDNKSAKDKPKGGKGGGYASREEAEAAAAAKKAAEEEKKAPEAPAGNAVAPDSSSTQADQNPPAPSAGEEKAPPAPGPVEDGKSLVGAAVKSELSRIVAKANSFGWTDTKEINAKLNELIPAQGADLNDLPGTWRKEHVEMIISYFEMNKKGKK